MRASTKRVLSIIAAGLCIIAVLLVYTSLIQPELKSVERLRSLVSSKENLFESQKKAVSDVRALLEQVQGVASVEEAVTRALPLRENVTYALSEFQALTKANSLTVDHFIVRPLAYESKVQPIVKRLGVLEVESSVTGSYEGIKNFIRGVETSARLMNVKTVTINSTPQSAEDVFTTTLVFQLFYQES